MFDPAFCSIAFVVASSAGLANGMESSTEPAPLVGLVILAMTTAAATATVVELSTDVALSSTDLMLKAVTTQAAKADAKEAPPEPATIWDGWKYNVDLGLNGSAGNSEALNFRVGAGAKRISKEMETQLAVVYSYATNKGTKSTSRGETSLRNDWNLGDGPWSIFAIAKAEYDEFQAWDWRVTLVAGPGYAFIKNDTTLLKGRVGLGVSREIGGQDNIWTPELDLGVDFSHKLSERTKIFATVDYYPSLKRFTDYRVVGKAGIEIMVDPELNLALKIGAEDRYQSKVALGSKKNDIDYFAVLSLAF